MSFAHPVACGIQALMPCSSSFLNVNDLNAFVKQYNGNVEDLGHEIYQLKRLLERTDQKTKFPLLGMLDLALFLEPYKMRLLKCTDYCVLLWCCL